MREQIKVILLVDLLDLVLRSTGSSLKLIFFLGLVRRQSRLIQESKLMPCSSKSCLFPNLELELGTGANVCATGAHLVGGI